MVSDSALNERSQVLKQLHVKKSRNHSPVLLTVPSKWPRQDRERITKMFFEKFNVPGLYLADKPLATLYGHGQQLTGLVVDFGMDETSITPIVEAKVQHISCFSVPVGMLDVKAYMKKLLEADAQFMRELQQSQIDDALLEHLLWNLLEVSPVPLENEFYKTKKDMGRLSVTFNNKTFTVGDARFKAAEVLFNPKLVGKVTAVPLPELLVQSVKKCDWEKHVSLLDNLMLSGSAIEVKGLSVRLEKELEKLLPATDFKNENQASQVKYGKMPEYIETYKGRTVDASYLGGTIMAKFVFPDTKNYLTKLDYNEKGPNVINVKGY